MRTINLQNISLGIMSITTIIAVSIVSIVSITEFGNFGIAQGQVNITSSLTPQQKAAICDPSNPKLNFVNSTESEICGIPPTPTNTTTTTLAANNTSTTSLYDQGYAKGVADAKSVQITTPPTGTMSPDDVDCDSSIDPQASNQDYCSGYQHGFADTYNNELLGK
ncbi:MAG: hypothetical protein ACJ72U_05255 [Nitrososphaeraceae archaeon]|jgi:hypothetical protein